MLKQQIQNDLKEAVLSKDLAKVSTLRMLLSGISYYEMSKGKDYQAIDEDVLSVVQKQIKAHEESIQAYTQGGRPELVAKEISELGILKNYLPPQLSEDAVKKIVQDTIAELKATSIQDLGKVMAEVMPKVKGKADGKLVSGIVQHELSS